MTEKRTTIATASRTNRSAVTNGTRLLSGVDGRSPLARRYRDLVREFTADLGGEESVTEPIRAMIRQAAAVTVEAERLQASIIREEVVDTEQLVRVTNTLTRLMNSLKAKAKPIRTQKRMSLKERLMAKQEADGA